MSTEPPAAVPSTSAAVEENELEPAPSTSSTDVVDAPTPTTPPVANGGPPIAAAAKDEVPGPSTSTAEAPQANGHATTGNAQAISTAAKLSFFARYLKGRNRVHDATYVENNAEQNEFMHKFAGTATQQTTPLAADSSDEPRPDGFFQMLGYYRRNFIMDASQDRYYRWTAVVTMAFVYNLLTVVARQVFYDLIGPVGTYRCFWNKNNTADMTHVSCDEYPNLRKDMTRMPFLEFDDDAGWSEHWPIRLVWIFFDVTTDLIYLLDIWMRHRTGFLEQGLVVRDKEKIKKLYRSSIQWRMDYLSLIPLDYPWGWPLPWVQKYIVALPFLRVNRLLRLNRVRDCMERTETRSSIPNAFRVMCVVIYIIVIIHWNACFYFLISETLGLGTDNWVYGHLNRQSLPEGVQDTLMRRYIYSFYWSTLILTTIGEVPGPVSNKEFMFVTMDLMCGVLIFATIVGNVGSMISNMSAARTEFQNKMDGIKQYMELRKVSKQLEARVIKWFDYLWANKQSLSDQQVLKVLPDKLQAEIAMQVHFETLRKVRIFQDCEAGLLAELVLKLQLQVFSPTDYICRKGDIGREMYIVKRGKLQVVGQEEQVFATLQEGAVFGELSILNIAGSTHGNRRTANVKSVGYTDLFVLNKNDLWNALREYPEARKLLLAKGRELLKKDGLLNEDAPEEQQTAEELAEQLNTHVKVLQTRMARLIVEHTSTETKLNKRIEFLETQLKKYRALARRQKSLQNRSLDEDPYLGLG